MDLLTLLIVVILIVWILGGLVVPVGTPLVHLLLVLVLIIVIVKLARGERIL